MTGWVDALCLSTLQNLTLNLEPFIWAQSIGCAEERSASKSDSIDAPPMSAHPMLWVMWMRYAYPPYKV